jgi:tetratricopeptide (TPR) repeat protein
MKPRLLSITAALLPLLACFNARAADTLDSLMKKGDLCDQRNETRPALNAYLAAQKLGPPNADLLSHIAKEYGELMADTNSDDQKRALGERALDCAKQAVAIDPNDALAQLSLAVCYGRIAPLLDNKTKIAYSRLVKEHADKALALDPNNDLTYNVLGSWNYALAGLNPFLRAVAGAIYGQLPNASFEEAVKDFQKAVQLNPNRLANHIGLGRALAALGRTAEAKEELQRGLSMPNQEKDDPFVKEQGRETLRKI